MEADTLEVEVIAARTCGDAGDVDVDDGDNGGGGGGSGDGCLKKINLKKNHNVSRPMT